MKSLIAAAAAGAIAAGVLSPRESGEAAYPGGNGRIAFERIDGGQGNEIFSVLPDGSGLAALFASAGSDQNPAWSPDGRRLAFNTNLDGNHDVYVVNADGTRLTNLTEHPAEDFDPTWSPDGAKISFVSDRDGDNEIFVVEVAGGGPVGAAGSPVQLTNNDSNDIEPAWSPLGDRIALQNGLFQIDLIDASDGGNRVTIVDFEAAALSPSWSPDGQKLAFDSSDGGTQDIWVVDADGTNPQNLTNDAARDAGAAWSPDGESIAYYSDSGKPDFLFDIWVIAADGSEGRRVIDTPAREFLPDWQPAVAPAAKAGDADCDGDADSVDALHVLRDVAGFEPAAECIADANVKCDDGLTSVDALLILRHVVGLPVDLPPGCRAIGT